MLKYHSVTYNSGHEVSIISYVHKSYTLQIQDDTLNEQAPG